MGKSSWGEKGALIGEWCGVELGVDRLGSTRPDCGCERSAPGWKVQRTPRGAQYVSRGFGTLYPLYRIVAVSWCCRLRSFGRWFRSAWFLSVWCAWVLCSWGGDFRVRPHVSGGRSCKGWRAQRTPRGAQCISNDASLFTIGNSSRSESSTLHSSRTRRRHGAAQLRTVRSRFGLQDGFGGVGWTVQRTPRGAQYMPRDVPQPSSSFCLRPPCRKFL